MTTPLGEGMPEYRRQQELNRARFIQVMETAGWHPIKDVFGGIDLWQARNGRLVNHTDAYLYWSMSGETPKEQLL